MTSSLRARAAELDQASADAFKVFGDAVANRGDVLGAWVDLVTCERRRYDAADDRNRSAHEVGNDLVVPLQYPRYVKFAETFDRVAAEVAASRSDVEALEREEQLAAHVAGVDVGEGSR